MPKLVSPAVVRSQLDDIIKRSRKGERFVVDQRGKPQVVIMIMGIQDYIKTIAPPPDFLKELWAEAKRKGLNKMSMREINAEIAAYRREKASQSVKKPAK